MAPISEKRSLIIKENVKENIATRLKPVNRSGSNASSGVTGSEAITSGIGSSAGGSNATMEILDFRESWLNEIELYKDQVRAQQLLTAHYPGSHNHHHHHHHHHYHHHFNQQMPPFEGVQNKKDQQQTNHSSQNSHEATNNVTNNRTMSLNNSNKSNKRRARTKSDSDLTDSGTFLNNDDELVFKRAREDLTTDHSNNIKKTQTKSSNLNGTVMKQQQPQQQSQSISIKNHAKTVNNLVVTNSNQINNSDDSELLTPTIVVNPFHAGLIDTSDKYKMSPMSQHQQLQMIQLHQQQIIAKTYNSSYINKQKSNSSSSNNNSKGKILSQTSSASTKNVDDNTNHSSEKQVETISEEVDVNVNADFCVPTVELDMTTNGGVVQLLNNDDSKAREILNTREHDHDDYDDFMFGDIDDPNVYDTSDDSEEEYTGCPYSLDDDFIDKLDDTPSEMKYNTPESPFTPSLFPFVPPYLTFSSHIERGPILPPDLHRILKWRLSCVMPKIVRRVVANTGFRLIKKTNDWMGSWDKHMKSPCFRAIRSHQKFNHLPGSFKIGRKDSVWRNIRSHISKYGKKEFGFMQKTFILPQDLDLLKKAWPKYAKNGTKWIIKPPASARGSGIRVVNRWKDFQKNRPLIVQKYIERPLLINGSKFDLRLYVNITSINPLRIYLHTDGLARFASVQYSHDSETLNDRCMHLTNYSINKYSENYAKNEDINACQGHKWTLKSLFSYFKERGVNTKALWGTVRNLVIKTVIGGESCLNRMFKSYVGSRYNCFELFGFDVLLDEDLIPWLLEVNISPSLHSDLPLDCHIKGPLIQAVLNSALYQVPPKLTEKQEHTIKKTFNLTNKGSLCFDKRIFTTLLTQEETKKHNYFTGSSILCRDEYINAILHDLTPDDIRCLIIAEDELARSAPLERIFPTSRSYGFLEFIDGPRYYNRLLDAWEERYASDRKKGIQVLRKHCEKHTHLKVSPLVLEKEPSVEVDIFEMNNSMRMAAKQGQQPAQSIEKKTSGDNCVQQEKTRNDINLTSPAITIEVR